jgi:hypothetical protein
MLLHCGRNINIFKKNILVELQNYKVSELPNMIRVHYHQVVYLDINVNLLTSKFRQITLLADPREHCHVARYKAK